MAKRGTRSTGKDSPGNAPLRFARRNTVAQKAADWGDATDSLLKDVIIAASIVGGAVRFGLSRDGGAYSVGIYLHGDSHTEWMPGNEKVDELLEDILDFYHQADADNSPSD